jgi:hypothetical protein
MNEPPNSLDTQVLHAVPSRQSQRRLAELTETHGAAMAQIIVNAELTRDAQLRAFARDHQARLSAARAAVDLRSQEGERELAPLYDAMEAARREWEHRYTIYENKRLDNQSALVPLKNEVAKLIAALHEPIAPFGTRGYRQWQKASWYEGPSREEMQAAFGERGG